MCRKIEFKTIQPYLVLNTDSFSQFIIMGKGISHFYEYNTHKPVCPNVFVPSGCIEMVFLYSNDRMRVEVRGTTTKYKDIPVDKNTTFFVVRFLPGCFPAFLNCSAQDLTEKVVDIADVFRADCNVFQQMESAENMNDRIKVFMKQYLSLYDDQGNNILNSIKKKIYCTHGNIKIKELEEYTGYTTRYLNKITHQYIGIGTKEFCAIVKFQNLLDGMNYNRLNLCDLAVDYGYFDQSHFIREFRKRAGMAPKDYRDLLKANLYSKKVVDIHKHKFEKMY